ncbi:hypothetical protein TanjilG_10368 [Lupinus angustifolius]|uniref:DUF674 family protein n=1 Tax=Lupinus angustifolius TaxID=3871 RepID=A0A4P1R4N7_LUPAN|nr:hypothetical protein TanjilG_10368 [Lupinus angustifolius]
MAAAATENSVTLRILIDKEKNKVVYAEAGKDFVDILLSFLTFPLGTIARLVANESDMNKVNVGSLNKLYESVANLDVKHFWTETCKEMLLKPRNSMEAYCQNLKLNLDDTEKLKFFICDNWDCLRQVSGSKLSIFKDIKCKCGKLINREIFPNKILGIKHEGFVQDIDSFIIFDNLKVMPDNIQNCVSLPMSFGYEDFNAIKVDTVVNVTTKEMVDLLKCSLLSETPLTDFFLRKKQLLEIAQPRSSFLLDIGAKDNVREEVIKLKLIVRKSNLKVLCAIAAEDFVDLLFTFMTLPLGSVEHMMKGNSCLGSIDNLYKSLVDLDGHKYLKSPSLKDELVKTHLTQQFELHKQKLQIDEVPISFYSCYTEYDYPAMSNISPSDIEQRAISIGKKECLSLLKASLISSSALTDGLRQFINPVKEEMMSS